MNTLEDMETQAQRHLDGCRVNTDRMAKNVLELTKLVRALQRQLHRAREGAEPLTVQVPAGGDFASAIDEILGGMGREQRSD